MPDNKKKTPYNKVVNCETCEYYDYDEEYDSYYCKMDLDEDEMVRFLSGGNSACPYYKFYDEYKSVRKQI